MTFPVLSVVRAALEAPVLTEVEPNDSFQLNASARVPDDFASLPECEVEDDISPDFMLDYFIPARRAGRTRSVTARNEIVEHPQRYEWVRRFLASIDKRTSDDLAGHTLDAIAYSQQISERNR